MLYLTVVIALSVLAVGLITYRSNHKRLYGLLFFLLSISLSMWVLTNFLVEFNLENSYFWTTQTFFWVTLAAPLFTGFISNYPERKTQKPFLFLLAVAGILSFLLFRGYIVESVIIEDGRSNVVFGSLYLVFTVYLLVSSLYLAYVMAHNYRKATPENKAQHMSLIIASFSMVIIGLVTNLLLPIIQGNNNLANYGTYSTLLFVGIISHSIWRRGLFDVRATIARGVGYILTIGVIGALYFGVFSLFLTNVERYVENRTLYTLALVLIAIVAGIFLQPLKKVFDKVTNRIFYRDSYDTQQLIDELNKVLVTTPELDLLLEKTATVMQDFMKIESVFFYIRETAYFPSRVIGASNSAKKPTTDDFEQILEIAPKINRKIHRVDVRAENTVDTEINHLLGKNSYRVLGRLVSTLDFQVKGIGLFTIGSKRSGGIYTKQDAKTLEIIANELVIAIENILRYEEIEQFNVTLQNKIDSATRELKESNEKLLALDEAKDEFVSMASHQLRTPLTSIKGYLSMVLEGDAGKITDTQKEMLGQAFFSSQRMVYLISDLLNVSRLKTGKFNIDVSEVNLAEMVGEEVSQLQEGAKAKNITLSYSAPKLFPKLMLDDMKTRQVVMNFTDNAIYYTPEGGTIKLSVKNREKSVEFTVTDSGIGVPKEQQHKLFTKFFRADNARKARPDGTGLGLFMAKKVIVSQGGSIIFKSKEGKGSTFGFSFPKEALQPKEQGINTSEAGSTDE